MSPEFPVGERAGPFSEAVTAECVAAFRAAIGATPGSEVPPTFLTRYRVGEFALFNRLGIDLANVLHGEQVYLYESPLEIGDELQYETTLTQAVEKKSGQLFAMSFLTLESRFESKRGGRSIPIGSARTTIVVRRRRPVPVEGAP